MKILLFFSLFLSLSSQAQSGFFATQKLQESRPLAFALQKEGLDAVQSLRSQTDSLAEKITKKIRGDKALLLQVIGFPKLSKAAKKELLHRLFRITNQVLKPDTVPGLVIDDTSIPGAAFFEFELEGKHPGKVFINSSQFDKPESGYAGLLLLIHETRHSQQLQEARKQNSLINRSLFKAFSTQKELEGQLGFSDFLTLIHEYEAFQLSNRVIGLLTDWKVDTLSMGTLASQYDRSGQLKTDLLELRKTYGDSEVLKEFNERQKAQLELLRSRR